MFSLVSGNWPLPERREIRPAIVDQTLVKLL